MTPRTLLLASALACTFATAQETPASNPPSSTSIYDSLRLNIPPKQDDGEHQLPPAARKVVATGKRYALIIGVGQAEFDGVKQTELSQCRFDARAMHAVLEKVGYECTTLVDGAAGDKPTINMANAELLRICQKAGHDDQILVYMSSHGGSVNGESFILMNDGAFPIPVIKQMLAESKALVRVLMLDCCRGDKTFAPQSTEMRDVHVILGCRPDEESQAGPNGLSVLTEAFVDGVTDCAADRVVDGTIELDEMLQYLDREVPKRSVRYSGKAQHPTRTIVDPKSLNPILGLCVTSAGAPNQPIAFEGPQVSAARNDWVLTGLLIPRINPGMTPDEVKAVFKKDPDEGGQLDAAGTGWAYFDDCPTEGTALHVLYEGGKVSSVSFVPKKFCTGEFDAAVSRQAVLKILDGAPIVELSDKLKGLSTTEAVEKLGCPALALIASDGKGSGQLRYLDTPRLTQNMIIYITDGKVTEAAVLAPNP
jgi:hypothetical protein